MLGAANAKLINGQEMYDIEKWKLLFYFVNKRL